MTAKEEPTASGRLKGRRKSTARAVRGSATGAFNVPIGKFELSMGSVNVPSKSFMVSAGSIKGSISGKAVTGFKVRIPSVAEIRAGLPLGYRDELLKELATSEQTLNQLLRLSRTTLNRRRETGRLTHEEGDRAATVARVLEAAVAYFEGDKDAATRWLNHSARAFAGETPLEHSDTVTGAQEVIDLLNRLEHGIPA